jgi:hypothetical protein
MGIDGFSGPPDLATTINKNIIVAIKAIHSTKAPCN